MEGRGSQDTANVAQTRKVHFLDVHTFLSLVRAASNPHAATRAINQKINIAIVIPLGSVYEDEAYRASGLVWSHLY